MQDPQSEITFERLAGSAVENAATEWVLNLERLAGRDPKDCRRQPGFPGDIDSPPRTIEIKAVGGDARGADLPLEPAQVGRASVDPDFYLYVVDNVAQGDPAKFRLRVFGGEQLQRLLSRVREKRYYVLPVPVAEFDSAPGADG
jgi:hypothetical protein